MSDYTVQAFDLSKRYQLGTAIQGRLTETLWDAVHWPVRRLRNEGAGSRKQFIWALKGVSLEIEAGHAVGILGRNGAGKSTLLKVLARITEPTEGHAYVTGKVGSLLEVGVGFHPDLTGAENIHLYGAILGMRRNAVRKRFDEIVEFAEVEQFVDTPVKRYSTGMHMRLAFAVAAHLDSEILIVDEVLAVGDAAFQKKCLAKMEEASTSGRTILFVSHNLPAISSLCRHAFLLESGRLTAAGATPEVMDRYLTTLREAESTPLAEREDRDGDGSIRLTALSIQDADSGGAIHPGSRLRIALQYRSATPVRGARFLARIYDVRHAGIFRLDSDAEGGLPSSLAAEGEVVCVTEPINITPGSCTVDVAVRRGGVVADHVEYAASFEVEPSGFHGWRELPPRTSALTLRRHTWTSESA